MTTVEQFEKVARAPNRTMITLIAMAATVMQVLDTTIANVALPHMQGSLGATQDRRLQATLNQQKAKQEVKDLKAQLANLARHFGGFRT